MSDAAKAAVLSGIDAFRDEIAENWPDDSTQPPDDDGDDQGPDPVDPTPGDPGDVPPVPAPDPNAKFQTQVGPWRMSRSNAEMQLINYFKTNINAWREGGPDSAQINASLIDHNTGYPKALPQGKKISTAWYFDILGADGDWVLYVEGDADVSLGLIGAGVSKNKIDAKRTEFTIPPNMKPKAYVLIDRIGPGGIKDIVICRKADEAAYKSGKVWQQRCLDEVSPYDIIRTMDLQNTTSGIFINDADDVATMDYAFWGGKGPPYAKAKQSCPLEALFRLGVEADSEIWFQAPLSLGFPYDWKDPLTASSDSIPSMLQAAKKNYDAIMSSPEWDKYADNVVQALEASGYPENRRLIISGDNEVWAYHSFPSRRMSEYSNGIGQAFIGGSGQWRYRQGYGILISRLMIAMDAAFARAGRNQAHIYIIETQADNDYTSYQALEFSRQYITRAGRDWADYAPRMGLSPASYWGSTKAWKAYEAQTTSPSADGFADYLIGGPAKVLGTKSWLLSEFRRHEGRAKAYGVKLFGAYEGGNHTIKPGSMPRQVYKDFTWGDAGARVNVEIAKALIAQNPGVVLSNYGTVGPTGGQPWFEGPYGEDNPKRDSWKQILAMR